MHGESLISCLSTTISKSSSKLILWMQDGGTKLVLLTAEEGLISRERGPRRDPSGLVLELRPGSSACTQLALGAVELLAAFGNSVAFWERPERADPEPMYLIGAGLS